MTTLKTKLLLLAVGLAVGLALGEVSLRIYSALVPRRSNILSRAWTPITVKDPRLGIRPNPAHPEHDDNGYRNAAILKEAFVVAMGDSHTYGTGVRPDQNWPSQLAAATGKTVYSMASGGWGPTQCLLLFDQALALHPRLIVLAWYDGNDFYDSFANVYYDHQLEDLKTSDPKAAGVIREAEAKELLKTRFSRVFRQQQGRDTEGDDGKATPSLGARTRDFLEEHSRLYRLCAVLCRAALRRLRHAEPGQPAGAGRPGPSYLQPFDSGSAHTVFEPAYRLFAMDLDEPRIAEGHRIGLEAIEKMKSLADAAGVHFLVLLLPTKELAFRQAVAGTPAYAGEYRECIDKEAYAREKAMEFLRSSGIRYLNPLPALQESLARGVPPYPGSSDGHPNPAGYRIIAGVVADDMKKQGLAVRDGSP
jgi:lysophospholipase L1-like esterase